MRTGALDGTTWYRASVEFLTGDRKGKFDPIPKEDMEEKTLYLETSDKRGSLPGVIRRAEQSYASPHP